MREHRLKKKEVKSFTLRMTFMKLLTSTSVAETWVAMMKTVKKVITLAMSRQFRSWPWTETGTDFTRRLDFVRGADRIE